MVYSARLLHLLVPGIFALLLWRVDVASAALETPVEARAPAPVLTPPNRFSNRWVDTWASMPQLTEPHNLPPAPFNETGLVFADTTIRQTVRLTLGGDLLRIRISNAFGGSDLPITAVSVALPAGGAAGISEIQDGTSQRLTFGGEESVVVPMGALVVSDPVRLRVRAPTILTVTIYSKEGQRSNSVTSHPGSRTTSWFARGNYVDEPTLPAVVEAGEGHGRTGVAHWYWLSAVEVWTSRAARAVVLVGDSITDGRGSTTDGNDRWPDLLLNRMIASRRSSLAVINQAAGGNRILNDGLGPNGLARLDRDVLAHSSVSHAVIYIGVNDLGTASTDPAVQDALANRIIWAYKQMVERLHARDIVAIGATITPFTGEGQGYSDPNREVSRQKINEWIRTSKTFDAVVDFDRIVADPANPAQINPVYDTGDHLHLNVAGFQEIADKFPLNVFDLRL